jgi:hypothetical protein
MCTFRVGEAEQVSGTSYASTMHVFMDETRNLGMDNHLKALVEADSCAKHDVQATWLRGNGNSERFL